MRGFERRMIYTAYLLLIATIALFVLKAAAWELKTEGRLDKVCAACLAEFAGCMDVVTGPNDTPGEERDPKEFVSSQLFCVERAVKCGEVNKCKTRVVKDK